ncbi:MAG: capsular polysaccharide biosynthesis protein [Granulosicoccus sp.]
MGAFEQDGRVLCPDQDIADRNAGFAVTYSNGIRKIRHIQRFLGVRGVVSPFEASRRGLPVSCVLVWGRKQNGQRTLKYAAQRGLPVLYLEDGWIRSCSANAHSRTSYSLLIDDLGVYYDSTEPSSLERFLNMQDEQFARTCGFEELAYAAQCRQLMIDNDITKYNFCSAPSSDELRGDGRPLVLVLDQTRDDASVRLGGMNAESFDALLDRAIDENPEARVVVRTHPDVVAGRRKGYLQERARMHGIPVSASADNPIPWMKRSSVVYVGTSQLGYEALLCGCTVKVGGKPFYAGWGLTEDFQSLDRRVRQRSVDQLFHATHVQHAKYCCPVTGKRWNLHECLEHVQLQHSYFKRNAGKRLCVGITPWKRKFIAQFMRSPDGRVRFSNGDDLQADETLVNWSCTDRDDSMRALPGSVSETDVVQGAQNGRIRVEDGFIRSTGLGSDFVPPASLVFDSSGLYLDANHPSALEELLKHYQCSEDDLSRARRLRESIVAKKLTKYNVKSTDEFTDTLKTGNIKQKKILVVGQVEGDQSILRGSKLIRSNSQLLKVVRKNNPEALICFKPHPDVVSGNRKGAVDNEVLETCVDCIETSRSFTSCLDICDELHTITSLSGFEAIMRNVPVVTYGMPFYAGWGITRDYDHCERRGVRRTVDELVFLSLVKYPHYLDIGSGEFISVEQLVEKLHANNDVASHTNAAPWIRKLTNISNAMLFNP